MLRGCSYLSHVHLGATQGRPQQCGRPDFWVESTDAIGVPLSRLFHELDNEEQINLRKCMRVRDDEQNRIMIVSFLTNRPRIMVKNEGSRRA